MQIIQTIKNDFKNIPPDVMWVTYMSALWLFGWGFVDPMWSLYLKSMVNNYLLIGVLSSFLSLIAMIIVIPLGELEDDIDASIFLKIAFWIYIIVGIIYTIAGIYKIFPLLILGIVMNGIASPIVIVSSRTYLKKQSPVKMASRYIGLFNMLNFGLYSLAMFLGYFLIQFYNLNTMFLIASICSLVGFIGMLKIKPEQKKQQDLWKVIKKFFKENKIFRKVIQDVPKYGITLHYTLILIFFLGIVESLILVFIPLYALELNLSLGQIMLLMGTLYLPYIASFLFAEIADRYDRIAITSFGLLLSAVPMFFLYFATENSLIAILTILVAISLALINPAAEGMVTAIIPVEKRGEMTGVQALFQRWGKFLWPLVFGFIANAKGLNFVFLIVAILSTSLAILSVWLKIKLHVKWEIHIVNRKEKHKEHHKVLAYLRHPLKH